MKPQDFLKERRRLCSSVCKTTPCEGCPLEHTPCTEDLTSLKPEDFAKLYDIVDKWSDEHPAKTRQSEFLKMFPNARTLKCYDEKQVCIDICPNSVYGDKINSDDCLYTRCVECKKKFWLTPIDEDEVGTCKRYE